MGACPVPAVHQPGQAKGALHGVLQVMVAGVDGLVIVVSSAETQPHPFKHARDKHPIGVGEHAAVDLLDLSFDFVGDASIDLCKHAVCGDVLYRFGGDLARNKSRLREERKT